MLNWLKPRQPPPEIPHPDALRVVIEVRAFDKGGLEKVVFDTARSFDRARVAPLIVSAGPLGDLATQSLRVGLRVEALPPRDPMRAYEQILQSWRPQLAITHFSSFGLDLFNRHGIPVVSVIHNVYAFLDADGRRRFAEDDAKIDHYISVSPKATLYATERLGISAARITTIPNGLDLADHERRAITAEPAHRARFGIAPDDYVFLNVAAYNLHKGHHLMAAAMRLLLARRRDIRIVCVGQTVVPAHLRDLRARLKQEGLDRHMLLPGYAARVEDLFAMADAFLLPSFIEGWSIAMNEAMAFGKPMILSDTGGASEVIEHDDIGILLANEYGPVTALDSALLDALAYNGREYRTAENLAAAMERFADNRAHWAQAGARGREKLRQRYALSDTVRRHEAVMLAIAAGVPPA